MHSHTDRQQVQQFTDQATTIAEVLQKRFYHTDPMVQWGNEQNAWNTYNTIEALADYARITHSRRYLTSLKQATTDTNLLTRVMGDGVDDEGWAGIALVKAYRITHDPTCLMAGKAIFASMKTYWDDTCRGGVWWNFKKTYKNAITNELFFVLAMLLYEETHLPLYLDWAKREWDWFLGSGMINPDNLVNDGLHECRNNNGETWTYNQGVVLGGLHSLYLATRDRAVLEQAQKIGAATMERLARPINGVPILQEVGGDLNSDQQQFKGIFVRYLAQLSVSLPEEGAGGRRAIREFLQANANAAWKIARNEENVFNAYWHESERKPVRNATTQSSALDLYNAAVLVSGK